jgi:hypothetical protein
MRWPRRSPAVLLCLALVACGNGNIDGQCQHNFDCPAGEACASGLCKVVACGGCQLDEACGSDSVCAKAQGASCANHTCPAGYPCNAGGVCAKPCLLNGDCDPGFLCNSTLKSCAECLTNGQCAGKAGKPVCDTDPAAGVQAATGQGACVACNVDFDCATALGAGHYCDANVCKPGCKTTDACNKSIGETCDTSVSPGRCIQCKANADCAPQGPGASACDDAGHCVQCWGSTQAAANTFCGPGTPECNVKNKSCVACLPANNASGLDCGYSNGGTMDPHDARTCNPATYGCAAGCEVDAQCGCPRTAPGGAESACPRFPDQEHCDASGTTMPGVTGPTLGACVQCTDSRHCEYRIIGSTFVDPKSRPKLNGARCVADSCVEGCDADADCWPDHATSNGKICHLGAAGDANDHKCVECRCNTLSADGTYCEDDPLCTNQGKVCDRATLLCRKKRQNEQCLISSECGDIHDPTVGACVPAPAGCVYQWHNLGNTKYCGPGSAYGRCGVSCNDIQNNYCVSTTSCPNGSRCQTATTESSSNPYCVSNLCTN